MNYSQRSWPGRPKCYPSIVDIDVEVGVSVLLFTYLMTHGQRTHDNQIFSMFTFRISITLLY